MAAKKSENMMGVAAVDGAEEGFKATAPVNFSMDSNSIK